MTADIVEVSEFPDLAERYAVYAVPKIIINDSTEFVGAQPEPIFLAYLADAAEAPQSAQPPEGAGEPAS